MMRLRKHRDSQASAAWLVFSWPTSRAGSVATLKILKDAEVVSAKHSMGTWIQQPTSAQSRRSWRNKRCYSRKAMLRRWARFSSFGKQKMMLPGPRGRKKHSWKRPPNARRTATARPGGAVGLPTGRRTWTKPVSKGKSFTFSTLKGKWDVGKWLGRTGQGLTRIALNRRRSN